jgi:hypothetical protein
MHRQGFFACLEKAQRLVQRQPAEAMPQHTVWLVQLVGYLRQEASGEFLDRAHRVLVDPAEPSRRLDGNDLD